LIFRTLSVRKINFFDADGFSRDIHVAIATNARLMLLEKLSEPMASVQEAEYDVSTVDDYWRRNLRGGVGYILLPPPRYFLGKTARPPLVALF
jgi:hypothetical protein